MLVSINTEVGAQTTDAQGRFYNFMRCLQVVATATAGSTPVVNPVITSTGLLNGSYNCITVISNAEAGGWANGVSTNISANTAYNASAASLVVDLYQSGTGKTTYPYLRSTFGNFDYSFASGWTTYPRLQYRQGCTASNPASVVYTTPTDIYNNGNPGISGVRDPGNLTSYNHGSFRADETSDTIYIAATSNYLILVQKNSMCYFGLRTVSGWELTKTDNVPWVHMSYGRNDTYANWCATNNPHQEYFGGFGNGMKYDGTFPSASSTVHATRNDYISGGTCALSNQSYQTAGWGYGGPQKQVINKTVRQALQNHLYSNYTTQGNDAVMYEMPITDPNTGLNVPIAYPITLQAWDSSTYAAFSGVLPGIYRGMTGIAATLNNYVTASEYTIDGSTYIPVRTGAVTYPDLWFLRKA